MESAIRKNLFKVQNVITEVGKEEEIRLEGNNLMLKVTDTSSCLTFALLASKIIYLEDSQRMAEFWPFRENLFVKEGIDNKMNYSTFRTKDKTVIGKTLNGFELEDTKLLFEKSLKCFGFSIAKGVNFVVGEYIFDKHVIRMIDEVTDIGIIKGNEGKLAVLL